MNEALHGGNKYGQIPLAGGDFSLANKGVLGICFYFVNLRLVNFLKQVLINYALILLLDLLHLSGKLLFI